MAYSERSNSMKFYLYLAIGMVGYLLVCIIYAKLKGESLYEEVKEEQKKSIFITLPEDWKGEDE